MIDELVNDYCILGDDGAVIFASYDHVLEFVEKIRAEDALRDIIVSLKHDTSLQNVGTSQQVPAGSNVDDINMSEECVHKTEKSIHEYVLDCPRCGHCCQQREWVGFTDGEKQYLRALGFVGIDNIEQRLKRMNT